MENTVLHTLVTRRSIRRYKPDPIPQTLLDQIITAGLYAASGMGRQETIILQITDTSLRDRLMRLNAAIMGRNGTDPFYGAPVLLVVLSDRRSPTYLYDGSLVMGNLMNAAHALGLGSCWIHRAREEFDLPEGRQLLQSLGVTGDYEGIGHLALGYPEGDAPEPKPRREGRVFYVK